MYILTSFQPITVKWYRMSLMPHVCGVCIGYLSAGNQSYQNIFFCIPFKARTFPLVDFRNCDPRSGGSQFSLFIFIFKMGQIEELPDDYDESQALPKPPTEEAPGIPSSLLSNQAPFPIKHDKVKNADPLAPELPPAMAAIRSYTPDQLADMIKKTPLFMTDLENAGDEGICPTFSGTLHSTSCKILNDC